MKLEDIITWKLLNNYNINTVKENETIYFDYIDNWGERCVYESESIEEIYRKIEENYDDYWESLDSDSAKNDLEYKIVAWFVDPYNEEQRDIAEFEGTLSYEEGSSLFEEHNTLWGVK